MTKTKKVGLAGRFGPRYGSRVRHNWREVMERVKGEQKCPRCETKSRNMREFIGVWHCKKCGARWTGGAWDPVTVRGRESMRIATRIAHEEVAKKELKQ
jgi:large subunit ribosomal protein L37Ae